MPTQDRTRGRLPGVDRTTVLTLAVTVGALLAALALPAYAHTKCDMAELKERIAQIKEHLEDESRHVHRGSPLRRRVARQEVKALQEELEAAKAHLEQAKGIPCPDTDTLEGQVEELKEKLEHLSK